MTATEELLAEWSIIESQIRQLTSDHLDFCAKCGMGLGQDARGAFWTIFGPICKNCQGQEGQQGCAPPRPLAPREV